MAYVKANPGKVNFGTSGPGSIFHIAGAWLHAMTNTKVVFIHYKGAAPMHADLMAGTIQAGPAPVFVGLPYVKSGKLIPVVYLGGKRYKGTPDLKTVAEQGWPEYEYASWSGFLAPAKTPAPIIEAWHAAFTKVAKAPEIIAKMDADGAEMWANRPEEFKKNIITELARYKKIVSENGIKLEE
jgi:tripartite-type tricarboxylate transporter receptor subunit TctC